MEEDTDLVLMDFSVVDECGSEGGDLEDIQVLDEINSTNPSKSNDIFEDMVVLDISTSPTREIEEKTKKSYSSRRSDRSQRYRDKSPSKERSSRDNKSSSRSSSRRNDSRRQDRSRSRESRYKSSSDRRRQSRDKDKQEPEKRSSGKSSQRTPTKDLSKKGQLSGESHLKKSSVSTKTSAPSAKSVSKVPAKETQKTEKVKESKEKTATKKVSGPKKDAGGESENDGVTISADDNIFAGMDISGLNKSDFVTLTVVDEDDNVETHGEIFTSKDNTLKGSKLNAVGNSKEPIPSTTKTPASAAKENDEKTKQNKETTKAPEMLASKNVEVKKAPLKNPVKSQSETSSPQTEGKKEIEMVVVEDIGMIKKPMIKPKAASAPKRKTTKDSPNKFTVTEELFTVENVEEMQKQVSIIGVDYLQQENNEKKEDKQNNHGKKMFTSKRMVKKGEVAKEVELVVVEDYTKSPKPQLNAVSSHPKEPGKNLDKFKVKEELFPVRSLENASKEVSIVSVDEVAQTQDVDTDNQSETDLVEIVDFYVKDEVSIVGMEETPDDKKLEVTTTTTTTENDGTETKWFEVPREEDEDMEISIMDDMNTESKISETSDDDVIEVIFSNGEDEEEILMDSKTDFESNFVKDASQTTVLTNLTQDQKEENNEKERKEHNSQEVDEKDTEIKTEPEHVIEDGMELIVLTDTEDEENYSGSESKSTKQEENNKKEDKTKFQGEVSKIPNNPDYIEGKVTDNVESQSPCDADISAEDDRFIEDGTYITLEDGVSENEEEDDLGEIDEEEFLAMMQSKGLTVDEAVDAEDQGETEDKSEQLDKSKDSTNLLITVSQTSEKRNVKSSVDSQEKSQLQSPIDKISSNLAKIRKEMESASKQSKSGSIERSSQDKDKARSSRERSKDRGSRSTPKQSKDNEAQKSSSSEGDLRQVLKSKQSQGSRDLRDVIKGRKAKEIDESEIEKGLSEESPVDIDEYWDDEELVEIDTFYDDYRKKNIETVVVVDKALLPKEKEHWGHDTVGEVLKLPMKLKNLSIEDLESDRARVMLEGFDAFFVDLDNGEGAVYIDNSELKNTRPFQMLGKIAWFLKENPHVDMECDRAISFLLEEKLKTLGVKKKDQIPKKGLLYIRGIPKHVTEEKLAKSLRAIEAIIPTNLLDKRIGFAMVVYNTTDEVKQFLATIKIFDKTCISYPDMVRKRKELAKELQEHPEAQNALLDGDVQLQVHKRQMEARKKLMAIQEQIINKNKQKIKKTRNKKLLKQREKKKERELKNLMMRAKRIMQEEGLDQNLQIVTEMPGRHNKGRSLEEHEQLRSPLKNAELRMTSGVVPIEGTVRDEDYNRLRREVLDELKDDISNGKFRDQSHLEEAIKRGIDAKRMAETRSRISQWGSGGKVMTSISQPVSTAGMYTINQFKEDFRKTRVPVQAVSKPDSVPPNMVADSIEIMIPVPEGTLPPHFVPGQPQVMPVSSQIIPTPVQMFPRSVVSVSQVPVGNVHGLPTVASVQQPFPLSQAPQLSVQSFPHHGQMPAASYVQSSMPPLSVPSTIGQQVPVRPAVHPAISAGMAMQQQGMGGALPRPPLGLPMPVGAPGVPHIQNRPAVVGYPGSLPHGAVPRNVPPVPISNPPGTIPKAPVPRIPVPVVNPVTPAVIHSQPFLYNPATSKAPAVGSGKAPTLESDIATKKSDGNLQNKSSMQQGKPNIDDRRSETQSKSKGRDGAPAIRINVGSQFSRKSMDILNKRKSEDIDGVPMEESPAKKSKSDDMGPKSILKKNEPPAKIDMFETDSTKKSGPQTSTSKPGESQYKRQGNLISVPLQKGDTQQKSAPKPAEARNIGKKIQVLHNRIAQKYPTSVPKKSSSEPPQEDSSQGSVSPQTLSYLRTHQVGQQKTSYSSSESEDDSDSFLQRLKGPEGLMSLMDVNVSDPEPQSRGIQDMLKKWDYLAEKQKLQREKEKLARREAKLKRIMEKTPLLVQEYEENERKRQEKKKAQENDPLVKLLQSALEAAQQKANRRRSPSPVLTDHEEEDMSLSDEDEEPSAGGEFIIDYGHRSLAGQKDKPQKMTRRQRRDLRMSQKKAEMEYRKKMEESEKEKSSSEKNTNDELTEMLKSSLQAVQEHLDEMKKQKSQTQQGEVSQNPFLQNLMSRVQTHIKAQQEQSKVNSSTGQSSSQPTKTSSSSLSSSTTTSSSHFQKPSTQTPAVSGIETGSKGPGNSWASQMQPQHGGHPSIAPYVPLSSTVSNLPSNTFEYGHSRKSVQPSWSGGYGVGVHDEVSSGLHSQVPGGKPSQEMPEVFDYGHKSKAETPRNQPAPQKDTVTATSTQPRPQTDIHSLTIESISEILQVAKNIQASHVKLKDTLEKPKPNNEQQKKSGQEGLHKNSVGEFLKNLPQSGGGISQNTVKSMNKSGSGQSSAGPTGTRMHFHGPQSKNLNNQNVGQQGNQNNTLSNDPASQQSREKSESPPVEMFLGMEGSRYERQKQREEEERRKRMEQNSFGSRGNFDGQRNRGNAATRGMGRGSALPGRGSSSSSSMHRSGQLNQNQASFGATNSNLSMNNRPGHSQHSPVQNRPGQKTFNRTGQSAMDRSGHNTMNHPGQNSINRPGQNTMSRPGQHTLNRPNQPQHQGYSSLSHSGMQKKSDAESITELMTENELQSWENLQRQLRQSYLEDQISGPSVSAYDQRLKQTNQPMHSQNPQQTSSLDWFQQTKQLQMQERLKRQTAPKGILKGAPSKASKIWAEEDMEFHTTSKSTANWGQGPGSYGNKGQNSNLVHYANSDSD